jgi:hypothetical protein
MTDYFFGYLLTPYKLQRLRGAECDGNMIRNGDCRIWKEAGWVSFKVLYLRDREKTHKLQSQ